MSEGSQRVSTITRDYLFSFNPPRHTIAYGWCDELQDIYKLAGFSLKNKHPLNQFNAVLNALQRESEYDNAIFEMYYFKAQGRLARAFKLKEVA